jgi:hypothetical protein
MKSFSFYETAVCNIILFLRCQIKRTTLYAQNEHYKIANNNDNTNITITEITVSKSITVT